MIILCLIFILGCHGQEDFYSRPRNFSIEIIKQTGLNDIAIAPFSVWSLMAGAAMWTYGDYQGKVSKSLILPMNKTKFLEDYKKLQRTVTNAASDYIDLEYGIFVFMNKDLDILPEFKETMENYFDAHFKRFDFQEKNVVDIVDRYIEKRHPHVINIFHANDFVNASLIMCNIMKFSGYWKSRFSVLDTVEESFYLGENLYYVKMMHQKIKLPYSNMDSMNANIMELALGARDKFSLILIYPHQNKTLKEVYNNFGKVTLLDIFDKLENDVKEFGLKEVDLKLPRIKVQTNIILNQQLSEIGLNEVFASDDSKFSGITEEDLYISSIDHKAQFVIMETGVYVDSSTPGYFDYPIGTPKLEAEQPFIYFVVEKSTKTIIVGGLYSKARYV